MLNSSSEGGVFSGKSVLGSMLAQFLVQAIIVIALSRIMDFFLRFIRQPRVIAEVISGICLGPSILGQVPAFTNTIFPKTSVDPMKLVANIGLVLYMFLVGLELDPRSFFANIRKTALISLAGMVVPFGFGVALSWGLYTQLLDLEDQERVPFSSFLLFTGVAMSITAFPVLARILSERRLFGTTVGSMTISSAAFDDATAWSLLALVLSIINANTDQLTALWVFLTMLLYVIVLLFVVRPLLAILVRITMRSRRFAPSTIGQTFLAFTFVAIFISAWITEFIGVHAIFGAFLVGIVMPRGTGIVVTLTEKIEDLVSIVLLPLYFASSGLKTQISLLNDGITWAWLTAVVIVACLGKICGCMLAAKLSRMTWRESLSVGILMNTKGLVELIVLNIGLDAGVINDRIFAVMVVMCLVTTFMTSPLISWVYPLPYQVSVTEALRIEHKKQLEKQPLEAQKEEAWMTDSFNVLACLDRLEQVPSIVSLVSKLQVDIGHSTADKVIPLNFNVLRLMESSDRSSTMFYASSTAEISPAQNDPVLQMMNLFNRLLHIPAKCFYAVAPIDAYDDEVDRVAVSEHCDMVLMSVNVDGGDHMVESVLRGRIGALTTLLYVDRKRAGETQVVAYSLTAQGGTESAMNGHSSVAPKFNPNPCRMKVLVPFQGGQLDRKSLKLALRLSLNPSIHVTVLHISMIDRLDSRQTLGDQKRYGAIAFISSKFQESSFKTVDYDAEAMNEAKSQSSERPHSVMLRSTTTTSAIDCIVGECRQNGYDLIISSHTDQSLNAERKFTGPSESTSPTRKQSNEQNSTLRNSLKRRASTVWVWPATNESILGTMGSRLLLATEASLLVVGQTTQEEVTHV